MCAKVAGEKRVSPSANFASTGDFSFTLFETWEAPEHYVDVVVAVPVHQRVVVRRDVYVEDSYVFIFQDQVVVGFGGDFYFWNCLRGQQYGG